MHLFDIVGKGKDQGRKSKGFLDKPSFLKRIKRSIVARINIQFWKDTILFGSINPESRIFLRFCSGASTRSLVSFYDSVREHQPGVSYLHAIPFGSINPESRISYDSVREHQPGVSYLPTIPFGSINPESRIFLRFRSGASTRSLVSFYDSVREHQLGVSYFPTILFGSVNPESHIFLTIPFGSIDPESRIPLFYDSVREYQPGVSYFLMIPFEKCDNL